ncbi:hypothetical protein [Deinococcus sonorensis]|uniref:Phospholipase D-like domain-containing protein n=2 Tax=Deinococcus sonorensis TaxID=309891 RepID=A0AAU7UG92_9DEIO
MSMNEERALRPLEIDEKSQQEKIDRASDYMRRSDGHPMDDILDTRSQTGLKNLNLATFLRDNQTLHDFGMSAENVKVDVHFRELDKKLIDEINRADIVVGSVAWLTHLDILEALSKKRAVSIIVQKEDFLRPDSNPRSGWEQKLRSAYRKLRWMTRVNSAVARTKVGEIYTQEIIDIAAVRCLGIHNSDKKSAMPRAHNKFLVLCRNIPLPEDPDPEGPNARVFPAGDEVGHFEPYAVWTGSFNFTNNGTNSLENAVVLHSREVAEAYFQEWGQIAAISESLDWTSPWVTSDLWPAT